MPILADPLPAIVFNPSVGVFLPVNKDLFTTLLILEPDLVKSAAAQGAVGLDAAARLVRRQFVGGHCVRVVNAADDDGTVWIALNEPHDDLVTDARDKYRSP